MTACRGPDSGLVTPQIRHATVDDLPALALADGRAFGFHYTQQDIDDFRPLFEPERWVMATEPEAPSEVVGLAGAFSLSMTLPGGAVVPAPGVTWVSVATTHRRRGILRAMMAEQHRAFIAAGAPVSILTASQAGIYGRFGYGVATRNRYVEIDRRRATFRPGAPDPGGVRFADVDEVRKFAPGILDRWRAITPGAVSRSLPWWEFLLVDRSRHRGGGSGLFHLLHPDGYASYRIVEGEQQVCRVIDFMAATDEAHAALWRVLLGLDLVTTVNSWRTPIDDPLPYLLEDSRLVTTGQLSDGVWARILDVPAALSARRYAVEIDVVVEVADEFLGRGGRFRLRGGPEGATCEPVDTTPAVTLGISQLSSLLLGSLRAGPMARAGLIGGEADVLRRFDVAFVADREAVYGTGF